MDADNTAPTLEGVPALAGELVAVREEWRPGFLLALAGATALHLALVLWAGQAAPRYLGAAGGSSQTINVEIVDEADLRERGSPADETSGSAQRTAKEAPAADAAPAPAAPAAAEATDPRTATEATHPAETPAAQDWAAIPAPGLDLQQPSPRDAVPKQAKREPQPEEPSDPKRAKKPAMDKTAAPSLDLQVPLGLALQEAANIGSSSATRPPGITRSGENDRFGRDVVRALKKTMPQSLGHKGRVKVRIFLDERGNAKKVQLAESGGDAELDQSVVFAAYQTTFPFPPKGATVADRTFLITYIYR